MQCVFIKSNVLTRDQTRMMKTLFQSKKQGVSIIFQASLNPNYVTPVFYLYVNYNILTIIFLLFYIRTPL